MKSDERNAARCGWTMATTQKSVDPVEINRLYIATFSLCEKRDSLGEIPNRPEKAHYAAPTFFCVICPLHSIMSRLVLMLVLLLVVKSHAFVVAPKTLTTSLQQKQKEVRQDSFSIGGSSLLLLPTPSYRRAFGSSAPLAAKKKDNSDDKESMSDPLQLLLLYMTPWKNPNSIFVYMLAILYALGKYSESQH